MPRAGPRGKVRAQTKSSLARKPKPERLSSGHRIWNKRDEPRGCHASPQRLLFIALLLLPERSQVSVQGGVILEIGAMQETGKKSKGSQDTCDTRTSVLLKLRCAV